MANLAEQARAADGSPGRWLARAMCWLSCSDGSDSLVAPLFTAQLAAFEESDETLTRRTYLEGLGGEGERRESALALAAALCPVVPEPCVWLAHLSRCRGDGAASTSWAAQARRRLSRARYLVGQASDVRGVARAHRCARRRPGSRRLTVGAGAAADPRALFEALVDGGGTTRCRRPTARSLRLTRRLGGGAFSATSKGFASARRDRPGEIYPDLPEPSVARPAATFRSSPTSSPTSRRFATRLLALDRRSVPPRERADRPNRRLGRRVPVRAGAPPRRVCAACPVTTRGIETHPDDPHPRRADLRLTHAGAYAYRRRTADRPT